MDKFKKKLKKIENYNFIVFISFSIVLSIVLVMISMSIYNSSGAAQLDLSRPGYIDIRSKATTDNSFKDFPTNGEIDLKVIDQFESQFIKQSSKITSANVFSGDPLSPEALGIGAVF